MSSKPKLVVLHEIPENARPMAEDMLGPHFEIEFSLPATDVGGESTVSAAAVLARVLTRGMLDRFTGLEFVQTPSAGVEGIDLAAVAERGVWLANSHSSAPYVAEYAVALLLAGLKGIPIVDRSLRAGEKPAAGWPTSLSGKTVGIAGFGYIGQAIAKQLRGFDVDILCFRQGRPEGDQNRAGGRQVGFGELLERSDALFICLPLTENTRNLFDARALSALKPSVYIVNVGRAEVMEKSAIVDALAGNALSGLALDVWWEGEPIPETFLNDDRIILSSHRAGGDVEGPTYLQGAIDSLLEFATGKPLSNIVDPMEGY